MSGETQEKTSGWTVDTLHQHFQHQLDDMSSMLDERYATQTKAVDAAFASQQTAMQTAFREAKDAVQAALLAAEKAVTKAESASEKRFESVNEFRGQLADQANTFLPRTEADVRINSLTEKIEVSVNRINKLELDISRRLDLNQGQSTGLQDGWKYLVGFVGLMLVIINIYLAVKGFSTK